MLVHLYLIFVLRQKEYMLITLTGLYNKANIALWNAFTVLLCGKCIIWGGDFNISCDKINILCGHFNM